MYQKNMKKTIALVLIICISISCKNEKEADKYNLPHEENKSNIGQIQVLTLGSFHFNFPNLDIKKTDSEDQIDVLEPKYQKEIESIVDKLEKFKPTIIVIERRPEHQEKYDSLYTDYLEGKHELARNEEQQIGFRLAKRLGLKQLHCADAWGADYEDVTQLFEGTDSIAKQKFMDFFYNHPDSLIDPYRNEKEIYKTQGIIAELKRINEDDKIAKALGFYLLGVFKYETPENNQFGVDFITGWWFNRNLRIFRNIQRINTTPKDRVLVIFGAGHMNLLNVFFEASPEYQLLKVNDYLN
jgi:hypothetical protein